MIRYQSYLNTAETIIGQYEGTLPLAGWLKTYFREHPQMGSRDRKYAAELVYAYYRTGQSLPGVAPEEKIVAGLFLCNLSPHPLLEHLNPAWNMATHLPLSDKQAILKKLNPDFNISNIFPWSEALSEGVDPEKFNSSFLRQPAVFLRLRPGHEEAVLQTLERHGISFHRHSHSCISVPQATKVEEVLITDQQVVVQDYSSQQTGRFIPLASLPALPAIWDCCAASGGKSLMVYDLQPAVQLTVSDVRPSILHNLQKRFRTAGIRQYRSFLTDLSAPHPKLPSGEFDIVVADVPCSGSGTWARTPEQLSLIDPSKIEYYHSLQKKIVTTAAGKLKPGGTLVYITCSVFKKENEGTINFLQETCGLVLKESALLEGYDIRADSMFVAVLTKD